MKSFARDGDSEDGGAGGRGAEVMLQTLRPATDSERHTIDRRASRTA